MLRGSAAAARIRARAAVPVALLVVLLGLTVVLWQYQRSREAAELPDDARMIRVQVARRLERATDSRIRLLQVLAIESQQFPPELFRTAASSTCDVISGCEGIVGCARDGTALLSVVSDDLKRTATTTPSPPVTAVADWPRLWSIVAESRLTLFSH